LHDVVYRGTTGPGDTSNHHPNWARRAAFPADDLRGRRIAVSVAEKACGNVAADDGLTSTEQTTDMPVMDSRDCLAHYPFVVVRIACRVCSRRGSYRLARLAAKLGPEITLRDLTDRFSYDCLWRTEARSKKGKSACGVYLLDLEHPRPPDAPPGMVKLARGHGARQRG
jgi:hypothetical protein